MLAYRLFVNFAAQNNKIMSEEKAYIVQYVGFQTALDEDTFLQSWTPFASSIKSAGMLHIDVYSLKDKEILTYIARNVWPAEAFLKNFPTGVPGAARTQDVNVLQFGGYWLKPDDIEKPESMTLFFQKEAAESEDGTVRARVTEKVPFRQMIIRLQNKQEVQSTNEQLVFDCKHIKSL